MTAARMARPRADPCALQLNLGFEGAAEAGVAAGSPAPSASAPAVWIEPQGLPIFRHPLAEREVCLGEHRIGYTLRRARRRSIGFMVTPEGLSVAAPRWVGLGDIELALRGKSSWIVRKLFEQHERAQRLEAARVDWRDGVDVPFLGAPLIVMLDPGVGATTLLDPIDITAPRAPGAAARLRVNLPHGASAAQIREAVQGWLQRQALRVFEQRAAELAARLGVHVRRLTLSSARTRWGSASADGSVRLHWRLVHFALPTVDYVVAHELAHLRHMDHSPQFWDVVRSVVPHYEAARDQLRHEVLPAFE